MHVEYREREKIVRKSETSRLRLGSFIPAKSKFAEFLTLF